VGFDASSRISRRPFARRLENRNRDRFAMNSIAHPITLVGGDLQKGSSRNRFHETIAQRIEDGSAGLDCLGLRDVLLGRVANGAIGQYGTSR
jgi:hypothetical protein